MDVAETLGRPAHPLPKTLDLAAAEPLREMLQTMPGQNQNMSLDGSGVERVSTACLQVLVAACRAVRARGKMFRIDAPSPLLRAALTDLGLADAALGEVAA